MVKESENPVVYPAADPDHHQNLAPSQLGQGTCSLQNFIKLSAAVDELLC